MRSNIHQVVKPRHSHILDVPGHVDDLAPLHQVLGLHLHWQVTFDHTPTSHLGCVNDRVVVEVLHKISHLAMK